MPGLFGHLNLAAKALQAQQAAIQVTGRNIANVNNPEYSRQRVLMGERFSVSTSTGPEGSGVEVLGIQQMRDSLLDRQVIRQVGLTESLNAQVTALSDAELSLGDRMDAASTPTSVTDNSSSTSGISGALDDFFNGIETLAATPADIPTRAAAIQSAGILCDRLNNADVRLATLQDDIERQLSADVTSVNSLLQDIAQLNGQIRDAEALGNGGASDLIDSRQADLEKLSKLIDFEMSTPLDAPNQVNISIGGTTVVSYGSTPRGPNPLSYETSTPNTEGLYPFSLTASYVAGKLKIANLDISSTVASGAIHGRYTSLTDKISSLRIQLNTLSQQIANSVNSKYLQSDGNGGTVKFFQTGLEPDANNVGKYTVNSQVTGLLQVNSAIDVSTLATGPLADPLGTNTNAGDNTFIRDIAKIRTTVFSTSAAPGAPAALVDGRIGDYIRTVVGTLAQNLKSASTRADEAKVIDTAIRGQRDALSGVSLDEETSNLMMYQRAYQANAKVISVLDSMLDAVINSMVR